MTSKADPRRVLAPAKINLTLHVTGQREDGYHLLDSLVAFADFGDMLEVAPHDGGPVLYVSGPHGDAVPTDGRNLILKTHEMFFAGQAMQISLIKNLPVSSGIGGGSTNAASYYKIMAGMPGTDDAARLVTLGADVLPCIHAVPLRMRGIGERLDILPFWPDDVYVVLVNPGMSVSTPAIFRDLMSRANPPMPDPLPAFRTTETLLTFLEAQRNDLQPAAIAHAPRIADVLTALAGTKGCALARMSGSGATCFGLYRSAADAAQAELELQRAHQHWWCRAGRLS